MLLYPEVQRKAQEEVDRVIGKFRLPRADDLDKLPYLSAVLKEVMRWHTVACMSTLIPLSY
jgi:cytochrome P450